MQELNDEDFIRFARHVKLDNLNKDDLQYIEFRLKNLGYELRFGCCGNNELRSLPR